MPQPSQSDRLPSFWVAWSVVLLLIVGFESQRWTNPETRDEALTGWLCGRDADWLPFLPIFLSGFVMWKVRGKRVLWPVAPPAPLHPCSSSQPADVPLLDGLLSLLLGTLAVGVAAWTGWSTQNLPPVYHDEYSYLFQALTFLDGRTWLPSFTGMPQLFDQVHVLNEGRFASRYFPGAGFYFAIFHDVGTIHGLWIAHGIVTIGVSLVAGEIAGRSARIVAGLAAVFCPGLCLFSQLYLAHLPTLVGLSIFLVCMLRLRRVCENGDSTQLSGKRWLQLETCCSSFFAGLGLSAAMLCRPMTAAGVGLPFGVWLFWWGYQSRKTGIQNLPTPLPESVSPRIRPSSHPPLLIIAVMGAPILAGIAIQLSYSYSITGKALVTPYQLYTDIYTPSHGYGFHNVERGQQHLGPKVLDQYNQWAENLTPLLALQKMGIRVLASGRWTLGLVPLVFVVVLLIWNWQSWSVDLKLIVASIMSLHLVHLPYWFEGIMGWHYVFETAPLWAIVLGVVTVDFARKCREAGHGALQWWWGGVLLTSLATAWLTVPPLWPGRLPVGIAELQFARLKYARFAEQLREKVSAPAIVFIRPHPAELHIDYVMNTPQLNSPILRARAPETQVELDRAMGLFPDRTPWIYDPARGELRPLTKVQSKSQGVGGTSP